MSTRIDLGLTATGAHRGGCACGGHETQGSTSTFTQSFGVVGMTCEHCVRSVTDELAAYPEVDAIDISLVPDGVSTVRVGSSRLLGREEIAAAIANAGYRLAPLT